MVSSGPQPDMNGHVVNDDPDRPLTPGHPLRSFDVAALVPKEIDGVIGEPHSRA